MISKESLNEWIRERFGDKDLKIGDVLIMEVQRQPSYQKYCQSHAPKPFVGHLTMNSGVEIIADYLRQLLKVEWGEEQRSSKAYYERLLERIIALGIIFPPDSIGKYAFEAFAAGIRDFSVADRYKPMLCMSPVVSYELGLLQLIHQLCQICLGLSGIFGVIQEEPDEETVLCHAVAEEFLIPKAAFFERWQPGLAQWQSNLWPLEQYFKTEPSLLARRARSLGCISQREYSDFMTTYHQGLHLDDTCQHGSLH